MHFKSLIPACLMALLLCAAPAAQAAEIFSDQVYCFSQEDFSEALEGICITGVPENGSLLLGDRILRPGDVLTADQLTRMTFAPVRSESDTTATVTYLPVLESTVEPPAQMTFSIRGKENKPPVAEDFAVETYKNLPIDASLKAKDPEGESMTFTVVRNPKRGEVVIHEDGTFTYTPKKNKVGIDSFVYTVSDAAGKVSREATVTVTIVKPTDAAQYTDTLGKDCRFAAEWMKNTGIFVGEKLDGNACFSPEAPVTRGEFMTMLVKALDIPADQKAAIYSDELPLWLQPYVAAAVRAGLTAGLPQREHFGAEEVITGPEAAVMLQNALELTPAADAEVMATEEMPDWAAGAVEALRSHGIPLESGSMTRAAAAKILYAATQTVSAAPGLIAMR